METNEQEKHVEKKVWEGQRPEEITQVEYVSIIKMSHT